jgi:hypothetical protein
VYCGPPRDGSRLTRLQENGRLIGGNDLWIAATGLAYRMPVLTRNVEHYRRVPGLDVEAYWLQVIASTSPRAAANLDDVESCSNANARLAPGIRTCRELTGRIGAAVYFRQAHRLPAADRKACGP